MKRLLLILLPLLFISCLSLEYKDFEEISLTTSATFVKLYKEGYQDTESIAVIKIKAFYGKPIRLKYVGIEDDILILNVDGTNQGFYMEKRIFVLKKRGLLFFFLVTEINYDSIEINLFKILRER